METLEKLLRNEEFELPEIQDHFEHNIKDHEMNSSIYQ